jgi:3'(2'), 5'-bisphosphate nucleotidase
VSNKIPTEANSEDHSDASRIAGEAARFLVDLRVEVGFADPGRLRKEADRRSHELIVSAISARHPEDPVLSEEGARDVGAAPHQRIWVIDPLDGTREFGEEGRTDFAVHVALVVAGTPRAGAVALPARNLVLGTGSPPRLRPRAEGPVRMVVSRSRASAEVLELAATLGAEVEGMGSAGAKAMAVVLGEADVYAHSGGQYEWDSAAPVAVARAAGLHASRLDGSRLAYGQPDAWLPDLLICRQELAAVVLAETSP